MWTLNGQPVPRNASSGWIELDGVQYPPDWPREDLEAMGLVWVEPQPDLSSAALRLLKASDVTILRCFEAGIAVPAAWSEYREALRAVARGEAAELPDRPDYPEGDLA